MEAKQSQESPSTQLIGTQTPTEVSQVYSALTPPRSLPDQVNADGYPVDGFGRQLPILYKRESVIDGKMDSMYDYESLDEEEYDFLDLRDSRKIDEILLKLNGDDCGFEYSGGRVQYLYFDRQYAIEYVNQIDPTRYYFGLKDDGRDEGHTLFIIVKLTTRVDEKKKDIRDLFTQLFSTSGSNHIIYLTLIKQADKTVGLKFGEFDEFE